MDRRSPPTSTRWPGPWRCWSSTSGASRIPVAYADSLPPASERAVFQRYPGPAPLPSPGHQARPAPGASSRRARWPSSCSASFARWSPSTAAGRLPPPAGLHALTLGRRSGPAVLAGASRYPPSSRSDPAAGVLASLAGAPPGQLARGPGGLPARPDVNFQRARAHLELGEWQRAAEIVVQQAVADPEDWRAWWWQAVLETGRGGAQRCRRGLRQGGGRTAGRAGPPTRPGHGRREQRRRPTGGRRSMTWWRPRTPVHVTRQLRAGSHPPSRRRSSGRGRGAAPGTECLQRLSGRPGGPVHGPLTGRRATALTLPSLDDLDGRLRRPGPASVATPGCEPSINRDLLTAALDLAEHRHAAPAPSVEVAGVPLMEDSASAGRPRAGPAGRWPSSRSRTGTGGPGRRGQRLPTPVAHVTCPRCDGPIAAVDRFCESCGWPPRRRRSS